MPINKTFPNECPACGSALRVTTLSCASCDTTIGGSFELPALSKLPAEDFQFVLDFIKCSGSLKIMAQQMGLSYPTVRNRLDEVISKIVAIEKQSGKKST
jgi:hypothetical protein